MAKYIERIARLPKVVALLRSYPEGLSLEVLAEQLGVTTTQLKEDLEALDIESWGWDHGVFGPPDLELVELPAESDGGPARYGVRLSNPERDVRLGVEELSAGDLAVIYAAGTALLEVEPDDDNLRSALALLAQRLLPNSEVEPSQDSPEAALLRRAVQRHERVQITYSRAWAAGVSTRIIEPLKLVETRRGWEVDAGPVGSEGNLRTYLLSGIRSLALTGETFTPPRRLESLLLRQRQTTTVRMELTQAGRWAASEYAEKFTVVEENESLVTMDLDLLEPVADRVARLLLASGLDTRVLSPRGLLPEALKRVHALREHHARPPSE